jgi:hypothetical protein
MGKADLYQDLIYWLQVTLETRIINHIGYVGLRF